MKTKNFPGRKTERRILALERMKNFNPGRISDTKIMLREKEMKTLEQRIAQGGKKYTKKNRAV